MQNPIVTSSREISKYFYYGEVSRKFLFIEIVHLVSSELSFVRDTDDDGWIYNGPIVVILLRKKSVRVLCLKAQEKIFLF